MHKIKTQRFGKLLVKDMLIIFMVIIKTHEVKKSVTDFRTTLSVTVAFLKF